LLAGSRKSLVRSNRRAALILVIITGAVLSGGLYWATTLKPTLLCGGCYNYNALGCAVGPCPGREVLNLDSSQLNSSTNMTLNIRNSGAMSIMLVAYTVKDQVGNQYTKMNWTGPSWNPNQVVTVNIVTDGNAFTFQPKYTYVIEVTSARNNLFTFTITA
jgi:hypothetical protein